MDFTLLRCELNVVLTRSMHKRNNTYKASSWLTEIESFDSGRTKCCNARGEGYLFVRFRSEADPRDRSALAKFLNLGAV